MSGRILVELCLAYKACGTEAVVTTIPMFPQQSICNHKSLDETLDEGICIISELLLCTALTL